MINLLTELSVIMADVKEIGEELHLETLDGETANIENRDIKEKALVRRIDKRMMPLMMLLCKCSLHLSYQQRLIPRYERHPQLSRPQQHRYRPSR